MAEKINCLEYIEVGSFTDQNFTLDIMYEKYLKKEWEEEMKFVIKTLERKYLKKKKKRFFFF